MITAQILGQALIAAGNVLLGAPAAAQVQQQQSATLGVQTQQPATLTATQPAKVGVTDADVTNLIQPHIGNEKIKGELGAAMRSMGIAALPECPPHLKDQMYAAFVNVLAANGIGGAASAAAPASII